jgi:uncharacterized protein (DUF1330 family)
MIEHVVGLNVKDNEMYQSYRDAMMPILASLAGGFRYDFTIDKTLKSETDKKINRLFVIYFPSEEAKENFFNNEKYKEIRAKYFEPSVVSQTLIAEYEVR